MTGFKPSSKIKIQQFEVVNHQFDFYSTSSSASGIVDGSLPYNTTVSSVSVSGFASDKTTPANDLIAITPTITIYPNIRLNRINVRLKYPATSGNGRYNLRFLLTLDNGNIIHEDYNTIEVGEF